MEVLAMKLSDDRELAIVARNLFQKIKEGLKLGVYPVFPPDKIVILENGKLDFETENGAKDLRECLHKFGATLYHLATGESEFNKAASYSIDGYTKPVESKYWPLMEYLLSGQAHNIPKIEDMLSWKKEYAQKANDFKILAVSKLKSAYTFTAAKIVSAVKIFPTLIRAMALKISDLKQIESDAAVKWIITLSCIGIAALILCYFNFNALFSSNRGMILLSIPLIVISVFTLAIFNDNHHVGCVGIIFLLILLYGATSFWAPMWHELKEDENPVIVDRKTEMIVGKLPHNKNDHYLEWKSPWINHFKYKVVQGLPKSLSFPKQYSSSDGKHTCNLSEQIEYSIPENYQAYSKALKRWPTTKQIEASVNTEINKLIPATNEYLKKAAADLPIARKSKISADIFVDGQKARIEDVDSKMALDLLEGNEKMLPLIDREIVIYDKKWQEIKSQTRQFFKKKVSEVNFDGCLNLKVY
jgi:hypothetical protein